MAKRDEYVAKKIEAHPKYKGEGLAPGIEFKVLAETGERFTLEMTAAQARDLIHEATISYEVAVPPLRRRRQRGIE